MSSSRAVSPLLSNAFLNAFDHQMLGAGHRAVRYADDLVIVCRTREEAEAALAWVYQVLEGQMGLRLHPQKTRIVHITEGFEFLGFASGGMTRDCTCNRERGPCSGSKRRSGI